MEKNMYMEVFVEKSSKSMGINGNLSSHIGAPEVLNKHKQILQKTHSGTSFSNVDRISTAHFHAPYAPEMHELGTGTVIRESCGWYWMMVCIIKLPSGYVKIAVENDHRNSKFSHWPWWFSIVLLVYQRVRWKRKHERCHWITFQLPCGLRPMIVSSTTTGSGFWTDLACLMISRCQVCIIGIMSSNPVGDVCNLNWQRQRLYKAANMVGLFSTNIWSWKCSECGIDQPLMTRRIGFARQASGVRCLYRRSAARPLLCLLPALLVSRLSCGGGGKAVMCWLIWLKKMLGTGVHQGTHRFCVWSCANNPIIFHNNPMLGLEALFPWKGSEKNMGHGSSIPIRQIILRPDVNLALMARDDHGLTAENSGSPV